MIKQVVAIGGGLIGSGWAARYLLHGINVTVYDPDPKTAETVANSMAAAERAWRQLTLAPPAARGHLSVVHTEVEFFAALKTADWVQESLPEREELKQKVLKQIEPHLADTTIIASSTSGLLPSRLQSVLKQPQRFCVAHPFTPVYLLPLVEICGGDATSEDSKQRAAAFYRTIGMLPLVLKKEIDGFIADRLMEALWREALWLVHDDIASTSEIDDAIRLGCGLRWAFMGPFLTYRLGGGEGGMRHFMQQFAPTLQLPWTKLMDTPEMDETLVDKIVAQSDAQAAGKSIGELMHWRDDCLVALMRSLAGADIGDTGVGAALAVSEQYRYTHAHPPTLNSDSAIAAPLCLHQTQVPAAWIDYNGHTTESRYLQVFGDCTDALLHTIGVDSDYIASGSSYYTVETHLRHLAQSYQGDILHCDTQLLAADEKRLHIFHTLRREQTIVATAEHLLLHVSNERAAPASAALLTRVEAIAAAHADLATPTGAGRHISIHSQS